MVELMCGLLYIYLHISCIAYMSDLPQVSIYSVHVHRMCAGVLYVSILHDDPSALVHTHYVHASACLCVCGAAVGGGCVGVVLCLYSGQQSGLWPLPMASALPHDIRSCRKVVASPVSEREVGEWEGRGGSVRV